MMNHPTKESSEQKNVSSLGNFGRKWLFLGIVLWLVLGVGSTLAVREIYGHEMSKVSEAYMKLARAPLLLHDYRTAMIQLSSAVEGGFRQVSFKDMDGNFVFKVPYREEKGFFDRPSIMESN